MIALLVKLLVAARLATAIVTTWPEVPADRAASAARAAVLAAGDEDPVLLLAIAIGESKLDWRAVNGPVAGPMQVKGPAPRTELDGYRDGVRALAEARRLCARMRNTDDECPLAIFASGPAGARGRWYRMPRRVMARATRIRLALRRQGGAS